MHVTDPSALDQRPVAVLGSGTLGRRIALVFATRGGEVRLYDPSESARNAAEKWVGDALPKEVQRRESQGEDASVGQLVTTDDLGEAVADSWLIVEAVPEDPELKTAVFADLDRLAPADAILASNSSSYPSRRFISHVSDPSRVLNMHFYSPPTQNAVDLMSCGHTDDAVMSLLKDVLPAFGIHPFEARKESTGFIFNRIWAAIKREALEVVAEGVSTPEEVDEMFRVSTGASQGPFALMDQVGLDVVLDIENNYAEQNPNLPDGPRKLLHRYVDAGDLGEKTGRGFFEHD